WRRDGRAAGGRSAARIGRRGGRGRLLAVRFLAEPPALARVVAGYRGAREESEREECRQGLSHAGSSWGATPLSLDLHRRCDLLTAPLLVFGDDHRARLQLGPGHLDRARDRQRRSVVEGHGAPLHALDRALNALVGVHLHRLLLFHRPRRGRIALRHLRERTANTERTRQQDRENYYENPMHGDLLRVAT